MSHKWFLFFLALLFLGTSFIHAAEDVDVGEEEDSEKTGGSDNLYDEDEYEEVDDDGEIGPHPQVETIVFFPQYADKRFIIGEPVTVLIGFANKADETFNITAIGAQFHSPYDHSYFIQNFTRKFVSVTAEPNQQVTLEYKFTPDKNLEPLPFWLSGWIVYNGTDGELYSNIFFNNTIEVIEKPGEADTRRFFTVLTLVAIAGLVAYFFLGGNASSSKSRKTDSSSSEQGTRSSAVASGWGDVPIYKQKPTQHSKRSRQRSGQKLE